MKAFLLSAAVFVSCCVICSCGYVVEKQTPPESDATVKFESSPYLRADTSEPVDDYVQLYAVIADTGKDYYVLNKAMYNLSAAMELPIDTMERYYDKKRNKIVLPETAADELYRGEYFPRRFPSSDLSLEYYEFYTQEGDGDLIALCAGIYETEKEADSALSLLKQFARNAFKINAKMYLGCMH